ncbi:MAG: anthranilate synthase component I [Hespellia sp.]|nr:anthranilate synthase component I [Hespellia sp.]
MYYPTLEQARKIAETKEYKQIPISCKIFSDIRTPIQVLRALQNVSHNCYMLESAEDNQVWGRYTFLGYDPTLEITCIDGSLRIKNGKEITETTKDPSGAIRKILAEHKSPKLEGLPTFTGGLVGYFSYDFLKYSEPTLKLDAKDEEGFKDVDVMLFKQVIAFDHYRQMIILITNISTENIEESYRAGQKELEELKELVSKGARKEYESGHMTSEIRALFDKEAYCNMVQNAKHSIKDGDIFQVVLSNRFEADFEGSLLDTYRVLRTTNPSPYMFYFSSDDIEVAGASPETLVKLEDGVLHTFPLAGTRPRGSTRQEDERLEKELLADEKERAEHNMLVDLGRNDIGKLSKIGSVEVEKYMEIERFSHVMHIGSTVKGNIREDRDALDAIAAVLPAGTLSGAPKIRACEIINELEGNKRGIYGGAIGYLDFTGNMDTCIAIRIAFKKNGKVFIRSGAGIVADSIPENEYQECINKAKAVVAALEIAGGKEDL